MSGRSAPVETIGDVSTRPHRSGPNGLQLALGQGILIAASMYFFLEGWHRDIRVPLGFSSDSLLALMQSKSTVDNGWWWFNPMLGAPFGFDELAFPANSNVDQALVWAVSRFVHEAATATNLAWILMVVLSGLSATWCLRKLGASDVSSFVAGSLFAMSPYALYRNIDHFWMVIYLVPFACTAALLLASGRLPEREYWTRSGTFLLAGCALLGFNYVYYPFFACFFIGVASIVGFLTYRHRRIVVAGGICVALIAGCTLLNLAPSLYSWSRHGRPLVLRDKVPAESDVYGLKIRQLIGPLRHHAFPPLSNWAEKEAAAQFPLETENVTSRLGLVGSVGFLALLGLLFVPGTASRLASGKTLLAASQLTAAAVLLATIGGFGSLFSLLISPEIRAYNRICPFIDFFALTAVALSMDSAFKTRGRRIAVAVTVLALGLGDQRTAAVNLNNAYPTIAVELPPLKTFVRQLERRLPDRAMVLQLPFRTYLNDDGIARMQAYDHLKLYLVSHKIRWSYPALSNDQIRWQQAAAHLDPHRLASQVAEDGFAAILVDRYGYEDNGTAILAAIRTEIGRNANLAETDRYIAVDIRSLASGGGASTLSNEPGPATLALEPCGKEPPVMSIDQIALATPPFAPGALHVDGSGEFKVSGWAVDQSARTTASDVDVLIDQMLFPTIYGTDRSDVAAYFKRPEYLASGFVTTIPARKIGKGQHSLAFRVLSSDQRCYYQTPSRPIVVD